MVDLSSYAGQAIKIAVDEPLFMGRSLFDEENLMTTESTAPDSSTTHAIELFGRDPWRGIGPFRGGRVVAVAGDPSSPMVFYFGAWR